MKLAYFHTDGSSRVGVVVEDRVYDLAVCAQSVGIDVPDSVLGILAGGAETLSAVQRVIDGSDQALPLSTVTLDAPLQPHAGKLFCLAGNYASHIMEGGGHFAGKEKMTPHFFIKPWTTVIATKQAIRIPAVSTFTDWELELAVVIGKEGRDISVEEAADYIAGYTIFNDISAREVAYRADRELQSGDSFFDWLVGKWPDTFGPMGPWITTVDAVPHPDRLGMKLWLNDELQQDANTGQMIFSPAEVIAYISQFVTLQAGDVISTGTPAGVGHSKKLQLRPGDHIRGEIESLGLLENSVEARSGCFRSPAPPVRGREPTPTSPNVRLAAGRWTWSTSHREWTLIHRCPASFATPTDCRYTIHPRRSVWAKATRRWCSHSGLAAR